MIYVILPIYNEADVIGTLLERINVVMASAGHRYKVLAVNDGSRDNTLSVLNGFKGTLPLEIIDLKANCGVAQVFRTSFKHAAGVIADDDVVITMDADNTHNPYTILAIVKKIAQGADVVVASCFTKKGRLLGVPLRRILLTFLCNGLYSILFPIPGTREYTGFYRGYKGRVIKEMLARHGDMFVRSSGFAVMAEFLLLLRKNRYRIEEVPMVVRYDLKGEKSKLRVFPTIKEHVKVIITGLR